MNRAKVLLMAIGAIGIVGGAIAAKAKSHFTSLRCTISSTTDCSTIPPAYVLNSVGSQTIFCDEVTPKKCTVLTNVNPD